MKNNPLLASISNWFTRTFSDPEAVGLFFTLVFGLLFFEFLGGFFMPVLISIALAYLLLPIVKALDRIKLPHILSVCLVYLFFLGAVIYILLVLFPVLSRQLMTFLNQLPHMVSSSKQWLSVMSQKYPRFISQSQVQQVLSFSELHLSNIGRYLLSFSFSAIPNIVVLVVYIILVPLLLLFFMMDSSKITRWFMQFLPKERGLVDTVFRDINAKIGVYIRGRVIELIVISIVIVISVSRLAEQIARFGDEGTLQWPLQSLTTIQSIVFVICPAGLTRRRPKDNTLVIPL